ncbi:hypothetical protein BB558_004623 [Smittium angustum]|uniref:Uncharacterized protein n=1 Tax=Smittium angustum TaxID=133377 RepID=A0A2U1J2R8_SMIAN|nr:hypothetical protein BB558_004623 [Smittium angustum]
MEVLQERVIEIPLEGSENVLEIDCSQLPENAYDICEVLEQENSNIKFYLIFALEYYKKSKIEEAVFLLKRGLSKDTSSDLQSKLPLINCLANIFIQKAKSCCIHENRNTLAAKDDLDSPNLYNTDPFKEDQAEEENVKSSREAFFQLATTLFKEADRIQPDNITTQLGKGILYLVSKQPDLALQQFVMVLLKEPKNMSALLGKARIQYSRKQYSSALQTYQQALKINPKHTPDPRIGIGMCFFKLGRLAETKLAFERSIKVNSNNAPARILLSILDFNEAKKIMLLNNDVDDIVSNYLESGITHLKEAYLEDPNQAMVLIHLSEKLLYRGQLNEAASLARKAYNLTDTLAIQAEALFQLARILHIQENFEKAYEYYQKTLALNSRHALARQGLGKIQVRRSEMAAAVTTFQNLLSRFPQCVEAMHFLGYLHSKLPNQKLQAVEYYENKIKTIAANGDQSWSGSWIDRLDLFSDSEVFLECSQLLESINVSKSKSFFVGAKKIIEKQIVNPADNDTTHQTIKLVEISNNISVLSILENESNFGLEEIKNVIDKCSQLLKKARDTENSSTDDDSTLDKDSHEKLLQIDATLRYNLGRAYESRSNYSEAKEVYTELVNSYPGYVDGFLRLGVLAQQVDGSFDLADQYFSTAYKLNPKNISTLLLQAELLFNKGEMQNSRRTLEGILKNVDRHDLYTLCSLGNYYLKAVRSEATTVNMLNQTLNPGSTNTQNQQSVDKRSLAATKMEYKKHMHNLVTNYKRAHEFYRKCLTLNPRCITAVNGFASVMAERGLLSESRDLLIEVRDAQALCTIDSSLIGTVSSTASSGASNTISGGSSGTASGLPGSLDPFMNSLVGGELPSIVSGGLLEDTTLSTCSNLAHIYVELGQYKLAINLYEMCLKRAQLILNSKKNVGSQQIETATFRNLQLCLARALYIQARTTKSIPTMRHALANLNHLCEESIRSENSLKKNNEKPENENTVKTDTEQKSEKSISETSLENGQPDSKQEATAVIKEEVTTTNKEEVAKEVVKEENTQKGQSGNPEDNEDSGLTEGIDTEKEKQGDSTNNTKPLLPELTISTKDKSVVLVDGCDPVLIYDLALAKQNLAQMISDLPLEQCTHEDLEAMIVILEESNTVFNKLSLAKGPLNALISSIKKQKVKTEKSTEPKDEKSSKASEQTQVSVKFHVDPKMASQRASFGKYLYSSMQKKIGKFVEMEEHKKQQAEASRKRRIEQQALLEAQQKATLDAQKKQDELLLQQTQLKNDMLRAEMARAPSSINKNNDNYSSEGENGKDKYYDSSNALDADGAASTKPATVKNRKPKTSSGIPRTKKRTTRPNDENMYGSNNENEGIEKGDESGNLERNSNKERRMNEKMNILERRKKLAERKMRRDRHFEQEEDRERRLKNREKTGYDSESDSVYSKRQKKLERKGALPASDEDSDSDLGYRGNKNNIDMRFGNSDREELSGDGNRFKNRKKLHNSQKQNRRLVKRQNTDSMHLDAGDDETRGRSSQETSKKRAKLYSSEVDQQHSQDEKSAYSNLASESYQPNEKDLFGNDSDSALSSLSSDFGSGYDSNLELSPTKN